ncbi:hypothetical protein JAAARDRAFT_482037 [Jaapia argillacea MUCL 33604]|uniref:Uncharacterized protein n=1 Tax=Jaapia argillacea MUCL 33604 TaxID=933084 RepID=A0A067PBR3_9AGAM|nr:hypothetical protein JAAARDRAFT_482037 [Jaapia argillacea MUCL 33604]
MNLHAWSQPRVANSEKLGNPGWRWADCGMCSKKGRMYVPLCFHCLPPMTQSSPTSPSSLPILFFAAYSSLSFLCPIPFLRIGYSAVMPMLRRAMVGSHFQRLTSAISATWSILSPSSPSLAKYVRSPHS